MARIQRANFWFGQSSIELVIVDAEDLKNETTSTFSQAALQLLQMQNCYDCEKLWPFEEVMGLENLLKQVEDDCGFATYLSWLRNGRDLHALGLGSRKKERKHAALLALSVACLLAEETIFCDPPLSKHLAAARAAQVIQLQPVPGQPQSSESWERDRPEVVKKSVWLPVSGSWIWWHQESLVVLCEDAQAKIFADAKNWFYGAAGVKEEPQCEDLPGRLQQDFQQILPNIFYTNLFRHGKYSVIAVGRDVKHRTRAGCLGLAAQICRESPLQMQLTEVQQLVVDEVSKSGWFPQEPLQRFYDLESRGFWQNMEMWSGCKGQELPVSKDGLSEIRMNAQPALLKSLEKKQWVEIDLTTSDYPWKGIIKGHREEREKSLFTGPGIKSFAIASDWDIRDPYQECPLIFFVVETHDGQRHTFHKLERTDETMRSSCSRKDQILAFRHAAGWEVKNRWRAFQENVFQNLLCDFREAKRPAGFQHGDFLPPEATEASSRLHAWRLSDELKKDFREWLHHGCSSCAEFDEVRSHCGASVTETFDTAVQGLFDELKGNDGNDDPQENFQERHQQETEGGDAAGGFQEGFQGYGELTRLQKSMLRSVLDKNATWELDPARCPDAEWKFHGAIEWCRASDDDIRFGHGGVSDRFIHGPGAGKSLDSLVQEIVDGTVNPQRIPALVAAKYEGKKYVVCGNRRLKCYKDAWQSGHDCCFKVIVHDFPRCPAIKDPFQRLAFIAKAVYSVDTQNDGLLAHVNKKRRMY